MKNSLFAVVAGLALSGLAFAQDAPAAAPQAPSVIEKAKETATEAKQMPADTKAKPADLQAEVVSVDAEKKTVTIKNETGEWTLPAEGAAADSLKSLKAGDKVSASIRNDATGKPAAITAVKLAPAAKY